MSYSNYYAASGLFHGSMSSVMGTQFDILMVGSDPRLLGMVWERSNRKCGGWIGC